MIFRAKRFILFLITGCLILVFSACSAKKVVVTVSPPTCEERLAAMDLSQISKQEISEFLDKCYSDKKETCWLPMIKRCLDENRYIPYRHLKQVVKDFNQYQQAHHFHEAVYRYFHAIIFKEPGEGIGYSKADKRFLEEYTRYAIHHCVNQKCQILTRARDICCRLDPLLYSKIFE